MHEALVNRGRVQKENSMQKSIRNFRFEKRINSIAEDNMSETVREKESVDKRPIECDNIEGIEFRPPEKDTLREYQEKRKVNANLVRAFIKFMNKR